MKKRAVLHFSSKKSQVTIRQMLIHIAMAALLLFVVVLMVIYVKSIENDTGFQNIFLSRDIALLMNTLYSAPGNVDYEYSFNKLDLSKFNLQITEYEDDKTPTIRIGAEGMPKNYHYGRNHADTEKYSVAGAKSFRFSKSEGKIKVSRNE
ncbi:hypothetical protein HYX08_03935 [Candidatus Woesearchaeota archaeon]|nr:hypothetical protein [Candidatus Woesearchaeota archaeon]